MCIQSYLSPWLNSRGPVKKFCAGPALRLQYVGNATSCAPDSTQHELCDWTHYQWDEFVFKILECPHSSISGMLVWNKTPHPTPTPSPPKWKFGQILTLWVSVGLEYPRPHELMWVGAGVWRLIAVSPKDTVSFALHGNGNGTGTGNGTGNSRSWSRYLSWTSVNIST